MSLAQQLLLRALDRALLARAVHGAARRAGAPSCTIGSCCRTSSGSTSTTCIEELRRAGLSRSTPTWFAPHFEFRFPLAGEVAARGDPPDAAAGARAVARARRGRRGRRHGRATSTRRVERLQVLVTGLTGDRFVVTCNGRPLPLQPTGRNGEYVAGVRYRAWQPPSACTRRFPCTRR